MKNIMKCLLPRKGQIAYGNSSVKDKHPKVHFCVSTLSFPICNDICLVILIKLQVCRGVSNHCILRLVLNVKIQAENTVVCMANLLSLKGHISSHFDTIHFKLSTHAYFPLLFHSMWSKTENFKNRFL